jgi:uncharacterized protein with HEPN domain
MKHPERVEEYLEHIAKAIRRATKYAEKFDSLEALLENEQAQDAIIRNITIIGEAANQIQQTSPAFVMAHPEVPWNKIRGMRNTIVHEYFDVDWQTVLDTVKKSLPPLRQQIEDAIAEARKSSSIEPARRM